MPQLRKPSPSILSSASSKQSTGMRRIGIPLPGLTIPPPQQGVGINYSDGVPSSPQYDQVLEELRQAQGRILNGNMKSAVNSVTAANPTNPNTPSKPGPQKKVRFLEDGTGNLHTSVFGGSTESIGSILDAEGLDQNEELSFESVISSLASYGSSSPVQKYDSTGESPQFRVSKRETGDLRVPSVVLEVLGSASPEPRTCPVNRQNPAQDPGELSSLQSIIHLEPDDPNSVDSGSVLSELDFEETSSTITTESNKTDSISSPTMKYQHFTDLENDKNTSYTKPVMNDPFAELSDLLEQSLQEIRWMEQDSIQRTPKPETPPVVPKREPLYELIGRKRAPPPQLNIRLSPATPQPSPKPSDEGTNGPDIWVPRPDWAPPKLASPVKKGPDLWVPRQGTHNTKEPNQTSQGKNIEENPIYARLWEASSQNVGNGELNNNHQEDKTNKAVNNKKNDDLTVIRSMARKARFEHWRLAGLSPGPPEGQALLNADKSNLNSDFQDSSFLSSLPLFQIPGSGQKEDPRGRAQKLGIELTWPPPPIPASPCSSSASATPVSPTCPGFPGVCSEQSPKCFGHDSHFQWPVPALHSKQLVKRSGSFKQETLTDSHAESKRLPLKRSESLKEKDRERPSKPAHLQAAQDWYWVEEFPQGAGIEPGTGNMSTWFHGAVSRGEAELRLANQPTGAFLARLTERLWGYALSVKSPSNQISHYLIDVTHKHGHKKYTLLGSSDKPHKTLRDLIQFYGKHPLSPDSQERLAFPCPQECAVKCAGSRTVAK